MTNNITRHRKPAAGRQSARVAACAAFSILAVFPLLTLQGCFTGIESTPRISEGDLRRERITDKPEQIYLADIRPEPPAQWRPGKTWTVTDARSERVLGADLAGEVIAFEGFEPVTSIVGRQETVVRFSSPRGPVSYRTDIAPDSIARMAALEIPYAVPTAMVDAVRHRMKGNTFYVNSTLWNVGPGNSVRGLRYIPVEVTDVTPGEGIYPLRVELRYTPDEAWPVAPGLIPPGAGRSERRFYMLMALPGGIGGGTTRDFADLFFLSDPRKRYPKITDEVWNNIVTGRVADGMTRDECRLSLGAPAEVDRRAGYSALREIWTYPDGIRLVFVDGILTTAFR